MAERIRFEQAGAVGSIVVEAPPLNLAIRTFLDEGPGKATFEGR